MMPLQPFQFLQPGWLLLLPLAWFVVWLLWRSQARVSMWEKLCDSRLLQRMSGAGAGRRNSLYWILGLLFTCGIVAAAAPSWSRQSQAQSQPLAARVLLIELSQAMRVEDVRPNRYSAALQTARDFLELGFDGETGIVAYAGAAFVVSPLARDAAALLAFIDALDPSTMPVDGSRIDLALNLAGELLGATLGGGQIVLIGTHVDSTETALQAARAIARQGHTISVLAIGNREGGPLKNPAGGLLRDEQGRFVISRPGFDRLQAVADAAGGRFIRTAESSIQTELFLRELARRGSGRERSNLAPDDAKRANDGYWLVWLMLPLTLLLFRKRLFWVVLIVVLAPLEQPVRAADWASFWQHRERMAHAAFIDGDYTRTLALSRDPVLRGSTLLLQGRYEQALEALAGSDSPTAHYNRGSALAHLHRFAEALLAFERTLELDPAHAAARHNKRLLEYYLEQQSGEEGAGDSDRQQAAQAADEDDSQTRVGIPAEAASNPGEDADGSPGLGVSSDAGTVGFDENFDGSERRLERLALTETALDPAQIEKIETWIRALPQSSTELYRRKFLRDYRRQARQER